MSWTQPSSQNQQFMSGLLVSSWNQGRGADTEKSLLAVRVIRRLKGGSNPVLVEGNDGLLYVVKSLDNPQGANVAFNESAGAELFQACGLPGPGWAAIWVSDALICRNPQYFAAASNQSDRPAAGWYFGSRFLGEENQPFLEILAGSDFKRIRNRSDFWKARLLDALCRHADNRQALFQRDTSGWFYAYFIDHGHLFGGPQGAANPAMVTSRYLDKRIYPLLTPVEWGRILQSILGVNRAQLLEAVYRLPESWRTPSAMQEFDRALGRISNATLVQQLAQSMQEGLEDTVVSFGRKPPQNVGFGNAVLRTEISVPGSHHDVGPWRRGLARS